MGGSTIYKDYIFNAQDVGVGLKNITASATYVNLPVPDPGHPLELDDGFEDLRGEDGFTISQPTATGNANEYRIRVTLSGLSAPSFLPTTLGTITVVARDNATPTNTSSFSFVVTSALEDDFPPTISDVNISDLQMTTQGGNTTKEIYIPVLDIQGVKGSSLQCEKVVGNASGHPTATWESSNNRIKVVTTHLTGNYTANNLNVTETFRVRISDNNDNLSAWKSFTFYARLQDNTIPSFTLKSGLSKYTYSSNNPV